MSKEPSIRQLLQSGTQVLNDHGVPNARRNVEWMLCAALGWSVLDLYTEVAMPNPGAVERYWSYVRRRAGREPLQYILGATEFMSLPFEVTPGVFVPRPDTESVVEAAERWLKAKPLDEALDVLDLCCGSGVIGVSLASRIPNLRLYAADASAEAVETTLRNAARNDVADRTSVWRSDAAEFLSRPPDGTPRRYTAIVCNPPYIASHEIASLPREVREHEPTAALDGGPDGLDAFRVIVPHSAARLTDGGMVILEIGDAQAKAVSGMLADEGLTGIQVIKDLSGRDRAVSAIRKREVEG